MNSYRAHDGFIHLQSAPGIKLQIPEGKSDQEYDYFAYILDCISFLFCRYFPFIETAQLLITNDPNGDGPICYKESHHIELSTEAIYWAQIAYQFSHELCHFCIHGTVDPNLRWFEESICETASLYFLPLLGNLWHNRGNLVKTSKGEYFFNEFIRYAADTARKYTAFDLKDHKFRRILERNCYLRKENRYVANHLLPIFHRNPQAWASVPLLCSVHKGTLEEALEEWIQVSPLEVHPALIEIRNLF